MYQQYEAGHVFPIDNDGVKFEMNFLDYHLGPTIIERIEGRREPETVAIEKSLVRPGDRVLELGGCYGYFTTILSRCVGPRGTVVSIEGTPNNFRVLQENIKLNNLANVRAYNYFVTGRAEQVVFGADDRGPYEAIDSLTKGTPPSAQETVVPAVRLSSFLRQIDFAPDHMFMDIEGFEAEVFADMLESKYLESHRPNIVFEIHSQLYESGRGLDYISTILHASGYQHRKIAGNWLCFPAPADPS